MNTDNIEKVKTTREEFSILETWIRGNARGVDELEILEAGCGRSWPFMLSGVQYKLTGLDLDEAALKARVDVKKDLNVAICGDLVTANLPNMYFDVVYSSHVLEHVKGAELVMKNFTRWLKPGGLLILRIPDRDTVFGFMTRITPMWFHVICKRYLRGYKHAGKKGYGPYPTYYDKVVSLRGIHDFCASNGLFIEKIVCQNADIDKLVWWVRGPVKVACLLFEWLSLGRLGSRHNNLAFVIRKP